MKRVCNKSTSYKEATQWDIKQHLSMTREERMLAAKILKIRVYGDNVPDIRESRTVTIIKPK